MFPSSSAPKRPRLSSSFDPMKQCVALPKQQKKKAIRCKPSKLTVIIVEDYTKDVPRGNYRKELQKSGRVSKLEFTRNMSAHEVQSAIIRGFQHLQVARITFLTCCDGKSNMLRPDGDQAQDGSALIDASQS